MQIPLLLHQEKTLLLCSQLIFFVPVFQSVEKILRVQLTFFLPVFLPVEKILQVDHLRRIYYYVISWHFLYPFFSHLRRFYESAEAFAPQLALASTNHATSNFLYPKIDNFRRFYECSTRLRRLLVFLAFFSMFCQLNPGDINIQRPLVS